MRRLRIVALLAVACLAALQVGSSAARQDEPELEVSDVIRMPSTAGCRDGGRVRIRLFSPRVRLSEASVLVNGLTVARMTGLEGSAAVVASVSRAGGRVRVEAISSEGQRLVTTGLYRRCTQARPAPAPRGGAPIVGGGED